MAARSGTKRYLRIFNEPSLFVQYSLAVLAVTLAALATGYIPVIGEHALFLVFSFAILQTTLWFGLQPGLFAFGLCLIVVNFWFLLPTWSSAPNNALVLNTGFCVLASLIIASAHYYRRATAALCVGQHDLNRAQAVAQTGSWRLNVRRNELFWSDENHRIFGIPRGTPMTYETFLSTVHPEDREYVDRMWQAGLRGEPYDIEHRIVVDGQVKWVRERAELEFDKDGTLLGGFGTTQDITERKRVDLALVRSEERLRMALAAAQMDAFDFDLITDRVNRIGSLGPNLNLPPEGTASDYFDLIHPDDRQGFLAALANLSPANPGYQFEYRVRAPDGSYCWIADSADTRFDGEGRVARILGVCRDVTERKRVAAGLRESEERFVRFMQHLPGLAWIKDLVGRYVYVNDAAAKAFRAPPDRLYGRTDNEIFPADTAAQFRWNDRCALASPRGIIAIETLEHEDGVLHHSVVSKFPILSSDGQPGFIGGMAIDITEQKRAEQALRESEERFRALVNASAQVVWTTDAEGVVVEDSHTWRAFTGQTLDQWLGDGWLAAYHPEDHEQIMANWRRCLAEKCPLAAEYRIRHASGEWRWTAVRAVPLFGPDAEVRGWVGMNIDITERKEADEKLRESEERYRLLVENSPDGILINQGGRFVYANPALLHMLGATTQEQILGRRILDYIHPSSHEIVKQRTAMVLESRQAVPPVEEKFIRLDGQFIDVEVQATFCIYEGQPAIQVMVRDITSYQRVQAKKFHALLESAPDAMVIVDKQGAIVFINAQAERLFGYSRQDLLGQPIERLIPQRFLASHAMKRAAYSDSPRARTMGAMQGSLHGRRRDGSEFEVEVSLSPIATDEGVLIAGAIRDITERKRIEEQLRASNDDLRKLSAYFLNVREEERARIARDIHDELGGTLTAIKMEISHVNTRAKGAGLAMSDYSHALQLVDAAIQSVRKVITDLRPSILDNLGLWAALEWLAQDVEARTGMHCQALVDDSAEICKLAPDVVTSIFRIVQEALANVARHAQASEVWVRASQTDGELEVEIEDNGRGITEAEIGHPEAWGLIGMSERVRQHNGRFAITGKPAEGTLITVRIPVGAG